MNSSFVETGVINISKDGITAYVEPVENFLKKLYCRSVNDPKATFTGLYQELKWPRLLCYAALNVLRNSGAYTAGVDKISKGLFLRTFEEQIKSIRDEVAKGINPLAVRRVWIPKPGKTEKRPLGIPVLKDRVIQEAIRMMLEAIYEPTFKRNSVGFRCGFSTQDALKDCWTYMQPRKKMQYVLEFDIRKFFDSVDHEILFKIIGEKIHDRKLRIAIWRIMKAEIYENGMNTSCKKGLPQGGVISPILANIYMHKFDEFIDTLAETYCPKAKHTRIRNGRTYEIYERNRKNTAGKKRLKELGIGSAGSLGYVRYADDGVAFWNGKLSELYVIKEKCKIFLRDHLKLELSNEKTIITNVEKGFKFVGFYFIRKRTANSLKDVGKYQKNAVVLAPKTSMHKIMTKITGICRESSIKGYDESYTILRLNQIIDGCYNYFKLTTYASDVYNKIFYHACLQYWYYLKRKGFKSKEAYKKFWRKIENRATWIYGKYAIRIPPPTQVSKKIKKNVNVGIVDGLKTTDRYESKKVLKKVTRIFPNDPIVPLDGNWRALRNKILERDHNKCVFCGKQATQVDHVLTKEECKCNAKLRKLRDKSEYLRSVCNFCHLKRHGAKWSWSSVLEFIDSTNARSNGTCQTTSEVSGSLH